MSKAIHLSEDSFKSAIHENTGKIIIDFWAPWCGPCRSLGKTLDTLSCEHEDIKIYKINVDECPFLVEEYDISSIPAMLFFNNGKLIDQTVGLITKMDILRKFY
ncbi:MAG: thioredoxin fold domain-containing protein [Puniceicoccales bacterium]|jgi:thioredoxin 1|nr:thioredoxin fold domain-containing protein [Puniceicoccales bacterium]